MADNLEDINCPACGEKMVKIFMPAQGVNLDVCVNGCGGIYFDNREFSKFDEPHEDISPLETLLKDKVFKKVDTTETRKCPVCRSDMVKNYSSVHKEVEVDECYGCGGKFLDYKELDKIRNEYNTEQERANDVIKKLYNDVGIEYFTPPDFEERKKERDKFGLLGLVLGAAVSVIIWKYTREFVSSLGSRDLRFLMNSTTVLLIMATCLIFRSLCIVLFCKKRKDNEEI